MFLKVITPREQLNQDHTRDEAAYMRPECDSAGRADRLQTSEELNDHPVDEHQPCRQRNECQEETKRDKREYSNVWKENEVGSHDSADCTIWNLPVVPYAKAANRASSSFVNMRIAILSVLLFCRD